MIYQSKLLKHKLLLSAAFVAIFSTQAPADDLSDEVKTSTPLLSTPSQKENLSQDKKNETSKITNSQSRMTIKAGDNELTIGGKTKIEHFFQKNVSLLNSALPDQGEYFKNTIDLSFDFLYGKETFGHPAAQAYTNIRHKGVWGRGAVFADSDASSPTELKLGNTTFGKHSHTNGKPLVWLTEGWLKLSINAMLGQKQAEKLHSIKLGWFPFWLGRGIALSGFYGLNREALGLYSYPEEKASPGICISGEIMKDSLWYDLYYSKFEERDKSIRDTLKPVKTHLVGRKTSPWRGVGKDDEVFAAHLKWKALNDGKFGSLELNPYVFYNEASDQKIELLADTKMALGAVGLELEHSYKNFSWGGEIAFNYGNETLKAIDRNKITICTNENGFLVEQFTKINDNGNQALLTTTAKATAMREGTANTQNLENNLQNKFDRFRPGFKNELRGWMGVVDAQYNFDFTDLSIAAAYGYASGDSNPHKKEENKTYKGFIGLHELYTGKRVNSIIILKERLTQTPSSLKYGDDVAGEDFAFTDLQHFGLSATWKPEFAKSRKLSFNPNVMFFWKATAGKKFDSEKEIINQTGAITTPGITDINASKFMGTEANLMATIELIKNFSFFGNFAVFVPGGYFKDVKGVPASNDLYISLIKSGVKADQLQDKIKYRVGDDTAYHVNVGFEFKF
jgi:hypothetical protein